MTELGEMNKEKLWKKARRLQYKFWLYIENNSNLLKNEFGIVYGEKIRKVLLKKWDDTLEKLGLNPKKNPIGNGMPPEFYGYISYKMYNKIRKI